MRITSVSCVVLAAVALGCGGSGRHSSSERYVLVASNINIPYWQTAARGLERAAADLRVQAKLVGPEKYDAEAQRAEFRRVAAEKPAGILVSVADPEVLRPEIDAAVGAGIPVVTLDSDAPQSRRLMFVGTNNYQAGLMGGRVLAQHLREGGNVIVFSIPAQANLEERLRGYRDALANNSRISILQVVDIRGDPALAFDRTIEIVSQGKLKVDAFVCLEATACKEVAEVLNRRNIRDKVVIAMDADGGTLQWIERGLIAATITQRPWTMAYYGLKVLDDLHHNKPGAALNSDWASNPSSPLPSVIDTGATLVDRTSIARFRQLTGAPAETASR